ncbi:hypothetical protein [Halobiforma nitratireducens]|uniref:Uncharacterized protein n=1 Tax=Halobiforma nitratireducens JCM 10879 TaxID=1227454 RepID=M0LH03_9EURY|nr:hypothetical protein [Halobiforma nitratireducens]EMA31704.1 hypothetical protein C446_15333 [Halobiforma nitratireducens JCM 10879]
MTRLRDLESIDVTLEQVATRDGDDVVVKWTATADAVEPRFGADTADEALRMLADELERSGGDE